MTERTQHTEENIQRLQTFFENELSAWQDARQRFEDLGRVQVREIDVDGLQLSLQFNPARMVSTGAKIDREALQKRPCFLCAENRPQVQTQLPLNNDFCLLVNPFPILPQHFTLPAKRHQPQLIRQHYGLLHELLSHYPHLLAFYNGPKCGASAPDHLHFQAGTSGLLPLQRDWARLYERRKMLLCFDDGELSAITTFVVPMFAIRSRSALTDARLFNRLYEVLPQREGEPEPMLNILAWREGENFLSVVIPREKHRPDCYSAQGEEQFLVSPGALDMGGLLITPRQEDFCRLTPERVAALYHEVGMQLQDFNKVKEQLCSFGERDASASSELRLRLDYSHTPQVSVGILSGQEVNFELHADYRLLRTDGGAQESSITDQQHVELKDGLILWNGHSYAELSFVPTNPRASFSLHNVTIGVNFHWEQQQTQTFIGELRLAVADGKIYAINHLSVEDYLTSVISSEMSATSSLELLKAHAVISRSWLLSQMENRGKTRQTCTCRESEDERIRWYDREDHTLFDVCADDHCQRYQGITKASRREVAEAVRATGGEVLTGGGEICDARFSKCCGGMVEEYRYCWEDLDKPYLKALRDAPDARVDIDLTREAASEAWIRSSPEAFCNTHDARILSQVLNDFDQTTHDFYRWRVSYTQAELSQLLHRKLDLDFGSIRSLIPLERGKSGRISRLKIIGTRRTLIVGKELEIRRALSESHLYSSAFIVTSEEPDAEGIPQRFTLTGAGWGHGVGLCQIGAAVMGERGYTYDTILRHYYPGAELKQLY